MLTNTTIEGLRTLRLDAMANGVLEQRELPDYAGLSFEDRLGLLVDRELTAAGDRRLARVLRAAKLRIPTVVEDLRLRPSTGSSDGRSSPSPRRTGSPTTRRS